MSTCYHILDKIASPLVASLLETHPNDATLSHAPPLEWSPWWAWASDHTHTQPAWLQLVHCYSRPSDGHADVSRRSPSTPRIPSQIPSELCALVDAVRSFQLERTSSVCDARTVGDRAYRMSPKKVHEVDRMSTYISQLVHSESPRSVWHAVDVGSGQGYLSRALRELDFHVLALDNDESQTSGANRWTTKEAARKSRRRHRSDSQTSNGACKGSLTHRTAHACPRTLNESITDWLSDPPGIQQQGDPNVHRPPTRPEPVPVLMVALHACGSLTVDVLRTFLSDRTRTPQAKGVERAWRPHSLVVVGCCYNLLSPSDFPLSKQLRDLDPVPKLPIAALHLAAQVPSQWLKDKDALRSAELALRKVVYRALLQPILQAAAAQSNTIAEHATPPERPLQPGLGETLENRRLGKLNDKAYQDWPTFLKRATDKLGIDLAAISTPLPDWFTHEGARLKIVNALYALQTLRCILGPLIETLILLDRCDWIRHELAEINDGGQGVEVEMINLFDQATGSGRNVALVIKPATIPQKVCPAIERS